MMNTQSNDQRLVMGKIVDAFGIKGWVKIHPFTEEVDTLATFGEWIIGDKVFEVQDVNVHGGVSLIAKLKGIEDRTQAEALKHAKIQIDRNQLPKTDTEEDEYYWMDLIDLKVINQSDVVLGKIIRLFSTGDVDVLVVQTESTEPNLKPKEIMIPYVEAYVLSVSLDEKTIRVDWELDW